MSLPNYLQPDYPRKEIIEYQKDYNGESYPLHELVFDVEFSNWVHKGNILAYCLFLTDLTPIEYLQMIDKLNRLANKL